MPAPFFSVCDNPVCPDAAAGPLPRATRYVSRYERGFLAYLEQAPAAALLRSA